MGIDGERLLADLQRLREFGRDGTGVHRPAWSEADMASRHWLMQRMAESGLDPELDGLGNVLGRSRSGGPRVLIGSHTDSVPHGGWLDGSLGVIYGLEVARSLPGLAVDVIDFQDEEGTYFSCAGSLAFTRRLKPGDLTGRRNAEGESLDERLGALGLSGRPWFAPDLGGYKGYLEAHIEQGPVLEREAVDIAVVTGIVGSQRWRLDFEGRADHAGTTPMAMRRDAGAALIRFAAGLLDVFAQKAGSETVWNLGHASFLPGASNVVPAAAELFVEFRDLRADVLKEFELALHEALSLVGEEIPTQASKTMDTEPKPMSPLIIELFEQSADSLGKSHRRLASGAGHDAMYLASHLPTGMIFIPSIDGRSHDVSENSHVHDIISGCEVMCEAARRLISVS